MAPLPAFRTWLTVVADALDQQQLNLPDAETPKQSQELETVAPTKQIWRF